MASQRRGASLASHTRAATPAPSTEGRLMSRDRRHRPMTLGLAASAVLAVTTGCTSPATPIEGLSTFEVSILAVNGAAPPPVDAPLPANRGDRLDTWSFRVEARDPYGAPLATDGWVRLSVRPGAVASVSAETARGRSLPLVGGVAEGDVLVTAVYGNARLWVEDLGYEPDDDLGSPPACTNVIDDDGDKRPDYPQDPGCEAADDESEAPGTYAAGASEAVHYDLPRIVDIQGEGTSTPYKFQAVQVKTSSPQHVVVTRVSSDGFYATDLADQATGYNHIYAFNFSTPPGMRVCDRLTYLAGTANEFFGGSQVSFPSYFLQFPYQGVEPCQVPEPALLDAATIGSQTAMERQESGLVRIEGFHVAQNFGPGKAINNVFTPEASNCDLNDDGQIDFENPAEASCSNQCSANPECSEWISFAARGNYKVSNNGTMMQINTGTVPEFDPVSFRGQPLDVVTGTLRNFSGGSLNWTIETRCPDDLVCTVSSACREQVMPSTEACVRLRTLEDNDEGSN